MFDTKKTLVFLDTETTWILKDNKNQITFNWDLIQLAYRKIENWTKTDWNIFVNTDTKMEIWAMATHGIYPSLLKEKSENKYLNDIEIDKSIFAENILIAHNSDFDIDVLERSGIECSKEVIDTLKVAKILLSEWVFAEIKEEEPEYVNMQYLRYYFELFEIVDENWKIEITTAHDAFWDVVVLQWVFNAMFEIIKNKLNISDEEVIELMLKITKKEYILIKTMAFWKYRGKTFEEASKIDSRYLDWIIWADFTDDIKYTCSVWLGETEDEKFFA